MAAIAVVPAVADAAARRATLPVPVLATVLARSNQGNAARGARPGGGGGNRFNDAQPLRDNAHLGTHGGHSMPSSRGSGRLVAPDPMRTSVDSMLERDSPRQQQWWLPQRRRARGRWVTWRLFQPLIIPKISPLKGLIFVLVTLYSPFKYVRLQLLI